MKRTHQPQPDNLKMHIAGSIEYLAPYVSQLVEKSRQEHIGKFCSDAHGRFSSPDVIEQWMDTERAAFLLVNTDIQHDD